MIDNKTTRLGLPLPDPENDLDIDVYRIINALNILDNTATVGDDSRIPDNQIPVSVARRESPEFQGVPKAPTALANNSSTQLANTKFVTDAISVSQRAIVGEPPEELNTLQKLALAIGNIPDFAQVISEALMLKADSNDNRFATVNGKSGGTISSSISINGASASWIQAPQNPRPGDFINTALVKSRLNGRGARLDPFGGYAALYFQEYVSNYYSAILNLNAGKVDISWAFREGGGTYSPLGQLAIEGSDVRLKDQFSPAANKAGERIDKIAPLEFNWLGLGRRSRGWVAQQLAYIDPLYVFEGGEGVDVNGDKFNVLNVDQNAIIADLIATVQELRTQMREVKDELSKIKNSGSNPP